jgi:hypothetical protein
MHACIHQSSSQGHGQRTRIAYHSTHLRIHLQVVSHIRAGVKRLGYVSTIWGEVEPVLKDFHGKVCVWIGVTTRTNKNVPWGSHALSHAHSREATLPEYTCLWLRCTFSEGPNCGKNPPTHRTHSAACWCRFCVSIPQEWLECKHIHCSFSQGTPVQTRF